jgi:hypothetical protein
LATLATDQLAQEVSTAKMDAAAVSDDKAVSILGEREVGRDPDTPDSDAPPSAPEQPAKSINYSEAVDCLRQHGALEQVLCGLLRTKGVPGDEAFVLVHPETRPRPCTAKVTKAALAQKVSPLALPRKSRHTKRQKLESLSNSAQT